MQPEDYKSTSKLQYARHEPPRPVEDKKMVSLATLHHTHGLTVHPDVLPRHVEGHDSRLLTTTTHSAYGGIHADDPGLLAVFACVTRCCVFLLRLRLFGFQICSLYSLSDCLVVLQTSALFQQRPRLTAAPANRKPLLCSPPCCVS